MANPTLLSRLLCADADKNTIPDTDAGTAGIFSQQYGWPAINSLPLSAGGKAVQRQDFNGVFYLLGGIAFYAQKGYTWEWDSSQDYVVGCIVIDPNNGGRYECYNDVLANATPPSQDPTNWRVFGEPIGSYLYYAGSGTPAHYLLCDGSAVSRTTYSELFAVIGTTYGAGDGTTTFNLPDLVDKFLEGSATAGTVKSAGLPNIKGSTTQISGNNSTYGYVRGNAAGAFTTVKTARAQIYTGVNLDSDNYHERDEFNASSYNSIYSDSVTTVQPPALTCRVLIKYE